MGTDLVPTHFPEAEKLPDSLSLRIQSITEAWPEADKNSFDLVHQRTGLYTIGAGLRAAVTGLAGLVKPGGWIQIVDADLTGPEADADSPLGPAVHLIKSLLGKRLDNSDAYGATLKHILEENGFVGVQEQIFDARIGAMNPNAELAEKGTMSYVLATEGMAAAVKSKGGEKWSSFDPVAMVSALKQGLEEKGALCRYWVVWGQKPL